MTPRDIRLLILTVVAIGLFGWGVSWFNGYRADQARLAQLETLATSVENRDKVSEKLHEDFYDRKATAAIRATTAKAKRKQANQISKDLAHEQEAVADFFAAPIPDSLREADRAARLSGGLEGGRGAGEGAGRSD